MNCHLFSVVANESIVIEEILFEANVLPEGIEILEQVLEPMAGAKERHKWTGIQEIGNVKQYVWK